MIHQGERILLKWFRKKTTTIVAFDMQLNTLNEIGIKLKSSLNIELLFEHFSQEEMEKDPYTMLLVSLGSEVEMDNKFDFISDDIWHLDTECIEDHGDYQRIIQRLVQLTKGSLKITEINDYIDIDNEEVWISFNINGEVVKHDLRVEDDWLDLSILGILNSVVTKQNLEKKYYYAVLGQDILIGFYAEEQVRKINKLITKIHFE